jgi:hypothetical protein
MFKQRKTVDPQIWLFKPLVMSMTVIFKLNKRTILAGLTFISRYKPIDEPLLKCLCNLFVKVSVKNPDGLLMKQIRSTKYALN